MTNLRKVAAGILIALALAIVGAILVHVFVPSRHQTSADDPVLKLAENMLFEDQQASLEGQESVTPKQTAMNNFGIALAVEASRLAADYEANEVAADAEYKGRRILVSGTVDGISKDFADTPYVSLAGDQFLNDVQARFADQDLGTLAKLSKGQKVYFVCEVRERVLTQVMLGHCLTVDSYTVRARQNIDIYVQNVLSGRQQIDKQTADLIASLYVVAHLLPSQSSCFTQADDACETEMKLVVRHADESRKQELQQKAKAFVATLNVR